jgi:hypothetical protein
MLWDDIGGFVPLLQTLGSLHDIEDDGELQARLICLTGTKIHDLD